MSASPGLTLLLSGRPCLQASDGSVQALDGADPWLLAWLALEGPTPRTQLMALLWPDEEPGTRLRNRLRQRLFALKRRLGVEVVEGGETLSLGAAVHWPGFLSTSDQSPLLDTPTMGVAPALVEWLAGWRERQHAAQREQFAADAVRLEREGRLAEAIDVAERRLRLEPLHEHAHRQLMRLHYLRGDRAAAILAFERCEQLLKDELGVAPGDETRALLAQIESASLPAVAPARPLMPSLLRPPRLVGRAAEWRQLSQAWSRGVPVVVVGEGGLGKSRLLADLAAAQSSPVLQVAARPGDADMPLTLLSRVLRQLPPVRERSLNASLLSELARLLPELGEAPAADATNELRLHNAVRAAVAEASRAGLQALVLDDLHLADAASLELLRALLDDPALRWSAALRPGPQPAALQGFLAALMAGGDAVQLPLTPLGVDAIAEFCDSLGLPGLEGARWAQPLHQRTGGNPQYMLEVLKAWWMAPDRSAALQSAAGNSLPALPTPVSLPALVRQRIETLSPVAVDLARCAAVAGEDFSSELAAAVLRVRPVDLARPWAELEAARVFAGERFAHDLIAEAAHSSVPAPVARAWHAEIAQALHSGVSPQRVEPARLAFHWAQAARWPAAAAAHEAAAARCAEQGRRLDEAATWHEAAQAWTRADEPARRFEAHARRCDVLVQYGTVQQARQALDEAQALARTTAQQRRVLALRLSHAQVTGDFGTTLRLGPQALEAVWDGTAPGEALPVALRLAGALAKTFRGAEALALLERLRDWIDGPEPSDEQRRQYWSAVALALDFSHRLGEAIQAWRTTQRLARRADSDLLSQAISNEAFTLNKIGRMAEAAVRGREALRLTLSRGDALATQADYQRLALGHHLRNDGRLAEALGLLQAARDALAATGFHADAAVATHLLALTWIDLGQPDRAHRPLEEAVPAELPPRLQLVRRAHRVVVAHALGDRGAGAQAQALMAAWVEVEDEDLVPRIGGLLLADTLPPERAEGHAVRLAGWFAMRQRMGQALAAHIKAARAALAQGAIERAWPQVQAADDLAREHQPDIVYGAERFWVAAQVHEALGHTAQRRQTLEAAQAWVHERAEALAAPLRRAFLERQRINADLLRWAAS